METAGGERELRSAECWQLLRTRSYGRIAVSTADGPAVFPVNALVDHGTVVFRSAEGSKLEALVDDPRVAYQVDGANVAAGFAWSVMVQGTAAIVNDRDEFDAAHELGIRPYAAGAKDWIVRITPVAVTGRWFAIAGSNAVILEPPAQMRPLDVE